jgi:hypothetical protein
MKTPSTPFGVGDGVEVAHAFARFHLHQQADLVVRLLRIAWVAAPARGPGGGHSADAAWRIAHAAHQFAGLLRRVHHRHQQGLDAYIQVLLDQGLPHVAVPHGHPRDRVRARVSGDHLGLLQQVHRVVGRVLGVQQQPVEAGGRADLGVQRPPAG